MVNQGRKEISRKQFTPEQTIGKLREEEVTSEQMETATNILILTIYLNLPKIETGFL